MTKTITRFPPSPTGNLHMGSARTALFNFLFAKHNGGKMVLRIENTDKERSKKEYEENILEGLKWLGITWEGELWRQSDRTELYKNYLKLLIEKNLAYEAEENKDGAAKVVRFKNPGGTVVFNDTIRGEIKTDVTYLQDFVIARSLNDPLYHLTVVIDDAEAGVTDIIRGEDGLANTARQILLQKALDFPQPTYTHIPFILGSDKTKLSKRHGAKSVLEYKQEGFLPQAVVNFLAMLGWRSKTYDEKEIWQIKDLIKDFSIEGIQKAPAVFNEEKLRWINKEHLKLVSDDEFWNSLLSYITNTDLKDKLKEKNVRDALIQDMRERINVYSDINKMIEKGEMDWLIKPASELKLTTEDLIWKKSDKTKTRKHLENLYSILCDSKINDATKDSIGELVMPYAKNEGTGDVLWPMRFALSGQRYSPNPFILYAALGKTESCKRLKQAVDLIQL